MPYDDTYSVLKRVAVGDFVFLDYKNGVGPQIEIKYKSGDKTFIHQASHRWAKHSGKFQHIHKTRFGLLLLSLYSLFVFFLVSLYFLSNLSLVSSSCTKK